MGGSIVKEVDAFCLCIDTLETPKILKEILKVGKPVLSREAYFNIFE